MDDSNLSRDMAETVRGTRDRIRTEALDETTDFLAREANLLAAAILDELADDIERTGAFCAQMYFRLRLPRV